MNVLCLPMITLASWSWHFVIFGPRQELQFTDNSFRSSMSSRPQTKPLQYRDLWLTHCILHRKIIHNLTHRFHLGRQTSLHANHTSEALIHTKWMISRKESKEANKRHYVRYCMVCSPKQYITNTTQAGKWRSPAIVYVCYTLSIMLSASASFLMVRMTGKVQQVAWSIIIHQ